MTKQEAFELVKTKAAELCDAIGVLASMHTAGRLGLEEWRENIFETAREIYVQNMAETEQDEVVHLDPREIPNMGPDWPTSAPTDPSVSGASWRSPAWDDTTG